MFLLSLGALTFPYTPKGMKYVWIPMSVIHINWRPSLTAYLYPHHLLRILQTTAEKSVALRGIWGELMLLDKLLAGHVRASV